MATHLHKMRAGAGLMVGVGLLALLATAPFRHGAAQEASFPGTDLEQAKQYAACMVLARERPQDAYDSSGTWLAQGGGAPAEHCRAVALIGLNRFTEAAQLLQSTAAKLAGTDRSRMLAARLYDQAGQTWLMENDAAQAIAASNAALELAPEDPDLLVDRAMALGAAERWWDAIDDLNRANELAPKRADILVLRASAYRYVGSPEMAMADVTQALTLDPDNAEGLLERGILEAQANNKDAARADWLEAVRLAPGTPTAEAAQGHLEQLDVKTQ
jgi:tetratricopeptide (TPR) repeat protein